MFYYLFIGGGGLREERGGERGERGEMGESELVISLVRFEIEDLEGKDGPRVEGRSARSFELGRIEYRCC